MSVLKVKFSCDNAAQIIHTHIAHWYPKEADKLVEKTLENFSVLAEYPETSKGDTEYENVFLMMEEMLDRTIDLQTIISEAIEIALENKEIFIKVELDEILRDVNRQVAKMFTIRDKAEKYGEDYVQFDKDFASFFFLSA